MVFAFYFLAVAVAALIMAFVYLKVYYFKYDVSPRFKRANLTFLALYLVGFTVLLIARLQGYGIVDFVEVLPPLLIPLVVAIPVYAVFFSSCKKYFIEKDKEKADLEAAKKKAVEEARMSKEKTMYDGTWEFPCEEFYNRCSENNALELTDAFKCAKARNLLIEILDKNEMPADAKQAYVDRLEEFLNVGKKASQKSAEEKYKSDLQLRDKAYDRRAKKHGYCRSSERSEGNHEAFLYD